MTHSDDDSKMAELLEIEVRGSTSEMFMLMMHDRIVALEAKSDLQEAQISQLLKHVKQLRFKRYDPIEKQFSDGSLIDWYIWEPVHSMHVVKDGSLQLVDESHSTAMVDLPDAQHDTHVELMVPVSRSHDEHRTISIPADVTVLGFFTAIHAFYDTEITCADIEDLEETEYTVDATAKIDGGGRVTWVDLLGSKNRYPPGHGGVETDSRRHPFSCEGLVRYEGVQLSGDDLVLMLGS